MSCFFCSSDFHVSHYCNEFITDKDRQKRATWKGFCDSCLDPINLGFGHKKCKMNQKCYICFSSEHHTVFCPDRHTASNMFLPKIDSDLLYRFMDLLQPAEKYSMAFSNPKYFNILNLKPLTISYEKYDCFFGKLKYSGSDFVVIDKLCFRWKICRDMPCGIGFYVYFEPCSGLNLTQNGRPMSYTKPRPRFYVKHLEIFLSTLLYHNFLKLLSIKSQTLKCKFKNFNQKWNFNEIFERAPFLTNIDLYETKTEPNASTFRYYGDYPIKAVESIKHLSLPFFDLINKHNVESLVAFMKTHSDPSCQIEKRPEKFILSTNDFNKCLQISLTCENFDYVLP